MKILSINPNDGLRHCTLGTVSYPCSCLGEAEYNEKIGALLKSRTGLFIHQTGGEYLIVRKDRVQRALEAYICEQHIQLYNRFFQAVFGEVKP